MLLLLGANVSLHLAPRIFAAARWKCWL